MASSALDGDPYKASQGNTMKPEVNRKKMLIDLSFFWESSEKIMNAEPKGTPEGSGYIYYRVS